MKTAKRTRAAAHEYRKMMINLIAEIRIERMTPAALELYAKEKIIQEYIGETYAEVYEEFAVLMRTF